MKEAPFLQLSENTQIRQVLVIQPPIVVHGTFYLLLAFLASVFVWAGFSHIDLIVKASGRVRPKTAPLEVGHSTGSVHNNVRSQVVRVNVHLGDRVKKGDILAQLDTVPLDESIAQLQHTLSARQNEVAELLSLISEKQILSQNEIAKAKADLDEALEQDRRDKDQLQSDLVAATTEYNAAFESEARKKELVKIGLRPQSDLDQAEIWLQKSKAALDHLQRGVDETRLEPLRSEKEIVSRRTVVEMEDLNIRYKHAQEELDTAQQQLSDLIAERERTTLRAYSGGVITDGDISEGDIVELGKSLFTIADEYGFQMEALVSSADVGRIQLGMPARIKFDAFDYQKYGAITGHVEQISPDSEITEHSQAAFYRVKITLPTDEVIHGKARGKIKLGMTGIAEIITDDDTILAIAIRKLFNTVSIR